mmetsp:Transcript_38943/g.59198  ORF Transcript_38943/g.59198 Transcript_38943/m.59198 type:complete len:104 (+) Transcript_38943:1220-1531(+)
MGYWPKFADLMASRFKERDDNVKLDLLNEFQILFKSLLVQGSQQTDSQTHLQLTKARSSFLKQAEESFPNIVKNLTKQLKSKNILVKVAGMKTFGVLTCMHQE